METMTTIPALSSWDIYKKRPLLMTGPCSAETEEQVMVTASALVKAGKVDVFRAGIWKPRTRPNSFEGVGAAGLKWLKQVKQEFGIPIGTEVATEKHVYEALKFGVDVLWVGARTTVNPFAVQEIANALQGVDVMVMVKNPINPELELWVGAIERIMKAGVSHVAAIHRGFSSYEKTAFRNQPQWQIPIDLRQRMPGLPLICDPSHIGGKRTYLADIAQEAMDLNFDGLMLETHIDPDNAWSDKQQQLTPEGLTALLDGLVLRDEDTSDSKFVSTIDELRSQIDIFDDQLLDILERRMQVAKTIGEYKKKHNITVLQTNRWQEIVNKAIRKAETKGLSHEFISVILKAIHQESIANQMKIMNEADSRA
ncbi:MAG: bifunctional 3-deoxy-7-phosphoheptulonate synthase/chorismate mutase type II [Lentimicrobium sp.]|nr:bifunctional 3-deoxy-7-phosphoheptulonate synthase/chorismate mutase type II [Lentimicrobium sp.]